jgi:hypothetical protein
MLFHSIWSPPWGKLETKKSLFSLIYRMIPPLLYIAQCRDSFASRQRPHPQRGRNGAPLFAGGS